MMGRSPFPPRQVGWRVPRHDGSAIITTAGLAKVLAAQPVFRGESLRKARIDWLHWTGAETVHTKPYNILSYGAYFPYAFGISGDTIDESKLLEMAAEHVYDPLTNVGGDPGGGAGQSDAEDWMGEDEVTAAEIFYRRWETLEPWQIVYTAADLERVYYRSQVRTTINKNRYFGQDGLLVFWSNWTPNPQDDNDLGVTVMDASINPSVLMEAAESGLPGGEDAVNQVRELIYGGDAVNTLSDNSADVVTTLKVEMEIGTPYALPGQRW